MCQWVVLCSVGTIGDLVSREDMLLRPAVSVGEGGGNDKRGDVVDFSCYIHLSLNAFWVVLWY